MPLTIPDVPGDKDDFVLLGWCNELQKSMEKSREARLQQYAAWRQIYMTGSVAGQPVPRNMMHRHINNLSAYLYSPRNVRFAIEYDHNVSDDVAARSELAASYLTRRFHRRNGDFKWREALKWALVKGSTCIKTIWTEDGHEPWIVHPEMMCVYREDQNGFANQEAFSHAMFLTPSLFERMIHDHPDKKKLMAKVQAVATADADPLRNSMLRQIIIGQNNPVPTGASSGNTIGNVSWVSGGVPYIPPEVASDLVRIDELWIQDARRDGDWTTIQIANGSVVIEGDRQRRNLCDVKGEQPFTQVCPNEMDGYFWGESEITQLETLQQGITDRITAIDRIEALQAQPPLAILGSSSMTQEVYDQLMSPGGYMSDSEPAKIENMAPKMPETAYADLDRRFSWFHDQAGMTPTIRGENEPGVRSGGQAETLVRTGSPNILDRALLNERQLAECGDFWFKVAQAKNPDAFKFRAEGEEREFLLDQMPEDYIVTIDAHSASPAFSEEAMQKATVLRKFTAIDDKDFIKLLHPPREDSLVAAAEKRAEAAAKFKQEHPEEWAKQQRKRR